MSGTDPSETGPGGAGIDGTDVSDAGPGGASTSGTAAITTLSITPVKSTRLHTVQSIQLDRTGAAGDRRLFVIDRRDRMVNAKLVGELQTVVAELDERAGRLSLTFPDGLTVAGALPRGGDELDVSFFSQRRRVRLVEGPWSRALSERLGQPLRLVAGDPAIDRGADGAVTLISRASLARLASEAGVEQVDARRFRMLVEIDGVAAHEEDAWVGKRVRIGAALVRFDGHVGRCLITRRDPETGRIDLPTLDVLRAYRGDVDATEPLPFGIYGRVLQPGRVTVGDPVAPVSH